MKYMEAKLIKIRSRTNQVKLRAVNSETPLDGLLTNPIALIAKSLLGKGKFN